MLEILSKTKNSQTNLENLTPKIKEKVIKDMATEISNAKDEIFRANEKDIKNATHVLSPAMIARLKIDEKVFNGILASLNDTAVLKDPVGRVLDGWVNYCGLHFQKVAIPIGVVCVIYESRPNVTAEVAALCFKSGNACVLKGGKEAINSNKAIVKALHKALKNNGIDENCITFIDSIDRDDTEKLIKMDKFIDVIVPRGGSGLIKFVTQNSSIPVIKHDKGVCHIFVDESANLENALKICINAKVQKPSACNAVETILVHKSVAGEFLPMLKDEFDKLGVKMHGGEKSAKYIDCEFADDADYETEYLGLEVNLRVVKNCNEAIAHIAKFGSAHSDAILSQNEENIQKFLNLLDSACLYVNASTRFSDGYEFGFGAEVGISTNKLHARGPMGLNELTTYKYIIKGNGQFSE
ncbi:MAG: glutamate-5-semialdehyde dehydrogenase [Campylobacter sp.]|nr:glutamate-5-semialdehyde dehydrogenase [Campylobacter sp.]